MVHANRVDCIIIINMMEAGGRSEKGAMPSSIVFWHLTSRVVVCGENDVIG